MINKKVTIVGAGMGAIAAIRALRQHDSQCQIEVIAPSLQFTYNASLIWVPTGRRQLDDLRVNLSRFMRRHRVMVVNASVTAIKNGGRRVEHTSGASDNDALIIAAGARTIKKLQGIECAYMACSDADKLRELQNKLATMTGGNIAFGFAGNPNEATAMRGGPIFELLFGVDAWLREQGRRDRFQLHFFSPAAEPGKRLGGQALQHIFAQMQQRGISTVLGQKLQQFTDTSVQTEQQAIAADIIVFQPGLTGPDFAANSELPLTAGGFIRANDACCIDGLDGSFVIGDAGVYGDSDWYPKQGHMADLHGRVAAANVLAYWQGETGVQRVAPELLCIIDMHNDAILVKRRGDTAQAIHRRYYHWAKIAFEKYYLWQLRLGR